MRAHTILFIMTLCACSERDDEKISDRPPFDEFWFSTRFNYIPGTSSYTGLRYYNVWGKMRNEDTNGGGYWYYLSNTTIEKPGGDGKVPAGAELIVKSDNGNRLVLEVSGTLPRFGERLPNSYVGDAELWNSTQCTYHITIEIDTDIKTVTKASYEISNGKFLTTQDITKAMTFTVLSTSTGASTNGWHISSEQSKVIANGDIRFILDTI